MLNKLVSKLIRKEQQSYRWNAIYDEVAFSVPEHVSKSISSLSAEPWVQHQHVYLSMLVEQGDAERSSHGFIVPAEVLGRLDSEGRELLELPKPWCGKFSAEINGQLHNSNFKLSMHASWLRPEQIRETKNWKWNGCFLNFGDTQTYLLNPAQLSVFQALEAHNESPKSEADNLQLIYTLQQAKRTNVDIKLAHFDTDKLQIRVPKSIGVQLDVTEGGNGILTPSLGTNADVDMIQTRLGQLRPNATVASLRIGDEIVLLDEQRLKATQEIIKHRVISKENLTTFMEKPTAFLDASLVDLDVGFSARVHGATVFRHSYFGDTDKSDIDWFGKSGAIKNIQPISNVVNIVRDEDSLARLKQSIEDAKKLGSHEFEFEGKLFDIADTTQVEAALEKATRNIEHPVISEPTEIDPFMLEPEDDLSTEVIVVDVDLNDEELEQESPAVKRAINEVLCPTERLNWDNYARSPFPHQETGIRWIVGLATDPSHQGGALLADDMGLGKTLMALASIEQLYKIAKKKW